MNDKSLKPGKDRQLVTPTPVRQAIARRMSQSKQQAPHFYISCEIEMDAALATLELLNRSRHPEDRISLTAVLLKAVALSLAEAPEFNAHWTDSGHELIADINIGVAMDLPAGLIAPAILDCSAASVEELSTRLKSLVARASQGKLRAAEMNDATFTLSNLGMFDVTSFTAIITPPQVAILATGRSQAVPRVIDGDIEIRTVMTATLSSDHRAVDGAGAARFLARLKKFLESSRDWM